MGQKQSRTSMKLKLETNTAQYAGLEHSEEKGPQTFIGE